MKRFLQCPGMCRIEVLKKFVQNKYNVNTVSFHIEILYKRVPLPNHYTLIDIAYIYSWKRNEPMKFFFRIMEKSTAEKTEEMDRTISQDIFVKPVKHSRNSDKIKTVRHSNKKKSSPEKKLTSERNVSPEKKLVEDKNGIINTDKIKDEIKSKLQDIGKGPVYTNITLNRSNNVEIITKVQKVSNKNGQPIGLNIIKQTVKKTNRLSQKVNANRNSPKTEKSVERPLTNGCKNDDKTLVVVKKEQDETKIQSKEVIDVVNKTTDEAAIKPKICPKKEEPKVEIKIEKEIDRIEYKSTTTKEDDLKLNSNDHKDVKKGDFNRQCDNKENEKEKIEQRIKVENPNIEVKPELMVNEIKEDNKEENKVVIQTVLQKKDFDIDEEKSNFLKSIELTARSALQTLQSLKATEKLPIVANSTATKPPQKRKNSSPVRNDKKKAKKPKTANIKPNQKEIEASVDKIVKLVEKQKNTGDLQSLFSNCNINIPSSLSITLKESCDDDRDRRNLASLKPVQNYIEILKLPDASLDSSKTEIDSRFKSKSAPSLTSKITTLIDSSKQATFQKMFEDSIKKPEVNGKYQHFKPSNKSANESDDVPMQNSPLKRNLIEIATQLHKKTKIESEKTPETLAKIPIPRLNSQKKQTNSPKNNSKFHQIFANMHSASLGMNYTVSVAQTSGKTSAKIEAKVENSLKSPTSDESSARLEPKVNEAQNLTKKEEKLVILDDRKLNGKVFIQNNLAALNLPSFQGSQGNSGKKNCSVSSPRSCSTKMVQSPRPPSLNVSSRPPSMSPRPPNMSPRPPSMSPRPPSMSPRPPSMSPRPPNMSPRPPSMSPNLSPRPNMSPNLSPRPNMSPIPNIPSPRPKPSPEKPSVTATSSSSQVPPNTFNPNHILEKYNIQNLAQLTASLNFNSAVFGMNHNTQLAALQQAMLLKQFEMHNRQNWQLSQYEKYLQNRLLTKEN